jgi:signal peptidase I
MRHDDGGTLRRGLDDPSAGGELISSDKPSPAEAERPEAAVGGRHTSSESSGGTSGATGETRRSFAGWLLSAVREVVIVVSLAMVLSLVVKTFLLQPFHIPSGSMEDTLIKDDRVVVGKLTPGPIALQRGDVVVFADPGNWLGDVPVKQRTPVQSLLIFLGLAPDDSDEHLIKRVIGLPGDKVACCDVQGRVTVNGVAIVEPYVKPGDTPGGGRPDFSIVVPAGKVWVMGDHRSDSADSRMHDDGTGALGSVPIDKIHGRALMVVWPLSRLSWITAPQSVFGSVPAATP